MKKFNGYEDAKKSAQAMNGMRLPVGAYICKIMGVRYTNGSDDKSDMITVQFDIDEGEQKGFFKAQYDANQNEDKKWKGRATIYVPNDDGSEKDGWTKNAFAKWTNSFEASNAGYSWDWDENKWKGLSIGLMFAETGTVIEGKEVTYVEPRFPMSVEDVKANKWKVPNLKKKNGYTGNPAANDDFMNVSDSDAEELPF